MKLKWVRKGTNDFISSDFQTGERDISKEVEEEIISEKTSLCKLTPLDALNISKSLEIPTGRPVVEDSPFVTGIISSDPEIYSFNKDKINELRERGEEHAKSLDYIPFGADSIKSLDSTLRQNVLCLFVCLAAEIITSPNHTNHKELADWALKILQSISKLLRINNLASEAILKPIVSRIQILKTVDYNEFNDNDMFVMDKKPIVNMIKDAFSCMDEDVVHTFNETYNSIHPEFSDSNSENGIDRIVIESEYTPIEHPEEREEILERCITALELKAKDIESNKSMINSTISNLRNEDNSLDVKTVIDFKSDKKIDPPSAVLVFLRNFITAFIMAGHNDARTQIFIENFAREFDINIYTVFSIQDDLAENIMSSINVNVTESASKRKFRQAKIAAAAIGSGALIAFTAGLAAPALAAGVAAIGIGGGLSAFLASSGGFVFITSMFGAGGAGLAGWKCMKRFATIKTFEFKMLHHSSPRCLAVAICISGQINDESDITVPWENSFSNTFCDLYALKWEPELLKSVSGMMTKLVSEAFAINAAKFWLYRTAASALSWPLTLIHFASSLDNAWSVCRLRARQAGIILATAIADKTAIGNRPVSLVGYSMGARVIYYALLKLYEKGIFDRVKNVVLMGLPSTAGQTEWQMCRNVVSGRLINVFSSKDWVLGFLYRFMEWKISVAGLRSIEVDGIENWDASGIVNTHNEWPYKMPIIMANLSFDL